MEKKKVNEIVARIIAILKEKKISQLTFCKELDIAQSTWYTWKNRGKVPHTKYMSDIASYLGVTVDYLLTGNKTSVKEEQTSEDYDAAVLKNELISSILSMSQEDLIKTKKTIRKTAYEEEDSSAEYEISKETAYCFAVKLKTKEKDAYYMEEFYVLAESSGKAQTILENWLDDPSKTGLKYDSWVGIRLRPCEFVLVKKKKE